MLYGFKQVISKPTRTTDDTATLIDVILSNNSSTIKSTNVIPTAFSDHDTVGCVRKINHQNYQPKEIECRNLKDFNKEGFNKSLEESDWQPVYCSNDSNFAWDYTKHVILTLLDKFAPKIKKRIRGKPCPWMNIDLKLHMNSRDQLLRKSRRTKNEVDIQAYKSKRNYVNGMIKKAKNKYNKKLVEDSANITDTFWNSIKKVYPVKLSSKPSQTFTVDSSETNDKNKIANAFCTHFSGFMSKLKKTTIVLSDRIWNFRQRVALKTCQVFIFVK